MLFKDKLISDRIPKHVAIIMDGNGRWAKARHLPKIAGHRAGADSVRAELKAKGWLIEDTPSGPRLKKAS